MTDQSARVVSFHYTVRTTEGEVVDSSAGREAMSVLLGAGNLIQGVDEALAAMVDGETRRISVPPEQGYGVRDEALVQRLPRKHFERVPNLAPGMQLTANGPQGQQVVTVVKVGMSVVDVDLNHPLAGETLDFDLERVASRPATEEEVEHGHAHGPGGHSHD
jgi:FKBP-type peptidyl-prolyl cis-trans isomerase SlyD